MKTPNLSLTRPGFAVACDPGSRPKFQGTRSFRRYAGEAVLGYDHEFVTCNARAQGDSPP